MVRQHHAAGADPDTVRHRGDLPDHDVRRGTRDRSKIVMLGQPVADVALRVRVAREIDAVAQRRGRFGAGGDDGKVEDRERNHRDKLMRYFRPTKASAAQIRRASATTGGTTWTTQVGQVAFVRYKSCSAHTGILQMI